ncbi:hypothetical protein A6A05_18295 [Magnetospirillum moscoviense]|uniref:Uncharacterized protein n=1 Tax=Magnetospirillum moscoviense TaxID=1437059 RepID=A0A178MZF1_9PROT|nr:hypothetical protein A6A05_18295 [Magnetospirillum moscoviense]
MLLRRAFAGQGGNKAFRHPTVLARHGFAGLGEGPQRRPVEICKHMPFADNGRPLAADVSKAGEGLALFIGSYFGMAERIQGHGGRLPSSFVAARENHRFSLKCALTLPFIFCSYCYGSLRRVRMPWQCAGRIFVSTHDRVALFGKIFGWDLTKVKHVPQGFVRLRAVGWEAGPQECGQIGALRGGKHLKPMQGGNQVDKTMGGCKHVGTPYPGG